METKLPDLIRFGREICGDLALAERREWWLANGLGGYASGTIAGTLTRRYHGLLVASVKAPLDRHVVMAKADATLVSGERSWPLFSNRWSGGTVDPAGYLAIETFQLDGRIPVWRYACGELRVESRVWMEHGENTTYVGWRLAAGSLVPEESPRLRVKLLANARDFHGTTRPGEFNPVIESSGPELRVVHPNRFTLYIKARGGAIATRYDWFENFDLSAERERGLSDRDSHLCVGEAELTLHPGEWVGVVASLNPQPSVYFDESLRRAQTRDLGQLRRTQVQVPELIGAPTWVNQLILAADSFVFSRPLPVAPDGGAGAPPAGMGPGRRESNAVAGAHAPAPGSHPSARPTEPPLPSAVAPDGDAIIAGYPWFGDWGRDTMIALPGLTLATGRYDTARRILQKFARFVDQGTLPNVFPGDKPEYNTVDAALSFIEAWRAYVEAIDDRECLRQAFPVLESIIDWHVKGTRYGIGMDPADGLLRAGAPGVQLTWMDAKVGEWVVTARIGKPVEINALWFNALSVMAQFAEMLKLPSKLYVDLAARARAGFQRFLDPAGGLFDVLDTPEGDDATVRPNQIFAVSLPFSPLDRDCQAKVVRACGRELRTSYGLRSLSPSDRNFHPYYTGGVWKRDGGYHQGPVWAFLLGHYALAEHRITGDAAMAQARLDPLRDHLLDAALGSVSEIFDGAPPHTPRARRLRRGRSHARSKRGGGWSRRNGIPSPWTPIRARPPRKNPKRGRRATASGGIQPLEIPLTVPI